MTVTQPFTAKYLFAWQCAKTHVVIWKPTKINMYHPKQQGFFPIIHLKIEEGLSQDEKNYYLGLTLTEKIEWIYNLPRLSSTNEDNIIRELMKLDFGTKSKVRF